MVPLGVVNQERIELIILEFITLVNENIILWPEYLGERVWIRAEALIWDYGDGSQGNGRIHRYERPGRYTVQLTVRYDNGWTTTSNVAEVIVYGDSDGDGLEDHLDPDRDNDGICDGPDDVENVCRGGPDAFPWNPWQSIDEDGDGVGDDPYACQRRDVPDDSGEGIERPISR